jgi:4-hydroxy-2-oxoheptanedioate aldolase
VRAERLLSTLAQGRPAFGTALHSPDPAFVEIAAVAGYDWVSIILEHAPLTVTDIRLLQRAADARGITTLVHVADAHDQRILPLLNEGVGGVVAPQVDGPEAAEALVRAVRFPPLGERGAAARVRSADYGARPYAEADATVAAAVIIETAEGVENAEAIFGVEGLTLAYIGLMDLTQSLGRPGQFHDARVREAIEHVVAAASAHGIAVGLSEYGYTVAELLGLGARLIITPTSAYGLLLDGLRDRLERAHAAARSTD